MTDKPFIPRFSVSQITKRFGNVVANDEVSFSVQRGSIHGVVGENGAGKSTIMKILYGMYPPDRGSIVLDGELTSFTSPRDAIAKGIGMVHQHFMLVPTLTAWQNIILGQEPSLGSFNHKTVIDKLEKLKTDFGFHFDLTARAEDLSVGHQQQVEILKLLYQQADLLILDEPTAVLTPQEVESLFEKLKTLQAANKTIVIITHKLREILNFTNFVTIMRQGKSIETLPTQDLSEESLAEKIIGRKRIPLNQIKSDSTLQTILSVDSLNYKPTHGHGLKNINFTINKGEIVGLAGIEGNGQHELIEILSRATKNYSGTVLLDNKDIRLSSTYNLKQEGFSLIPPDRHKEAIILSLSVGENAILGHHRENNLKSGIFLSNQKMKDVANKYITDFDIRPRDASLPIASLSGGNQQKLVVARETDRAINFLLAAHPTRGVDIGSIDFIHQHLVKLKGQGTGILLISSELEELLTLSDRILVIYQGEIVAETVKENATEMQLGLWMTRGGQS